MPQVRDVCLACELPLGEGHLVYVTEAHGTKSVRGTDWFRGILPQGIIRVLHLSAPKFRGVLHKKCWDHVWNGPTILTHFRL